MLVQHCTVITGVQPCGTGSKPFDLLVHMVLYYHVVMWYRGPMVLWCGAGSTIFDLLLVHMVPCYKIKWYQCLLIHGIQYHWYRCQVVQGTWYNLTCWCRWFTIYQMFPHRCLPIIYSSRFSIECYMQVNLVGYYPTHINALQ